MKKYLISICCVIGILFSSHHSQISAQNQFNIQLLGKPKTEIAKINFIDSISLEVPFVIQDRNGNVVSDPIDLVALKIGTDSYTGAIRDSIGSKEINLAILLDTSGSLNEAEFKKVTAFIGKTIERLGKSLVVLYKVADQTTEISGGYINDLKQFQTIMPSITNKPDKRLCLNDGIKQALSRLAGVSDPKAILIITNSRDTCNNNIDEIATNQEIPIYAIGTNNGVTKAELEKYTNPTGGLSLMVNPSNPEFTFLNMFEKVLRSKWAADFKYNPEKKTNNTIYPKQNPQSAELFVHFSGGIDASKIFTFTYTGGPFTIPAKIDLAGIIVSTLEGIRFNLNITSKELIESLEINIKDFDKGDLAGRQTINAPKDISINDLSFPSLIPGKQYKIEILAKNKNGQAISRIPEDKQKFIEIVYSPTQPKLTVSNPIATDPINPDVRAKIALDDDSGIVSYHIFLRNEKGDKIPNTEVISNTKSNEFVLPTYQIGLPQGKYIIVAEGRYAGSSKPPLIVESKPFDYVPTSWSSVVFAKIIITLRDSPPTAVALLGVVLLGCIGLFAILRMTSRGPKIGPREVAMGLPTKPKMVKIPSVGDSSNSGNNPVANSIPVAMVTLIEPAGVAYKLNINKLSFSIGRDSAAQATVPVDKTLGVSSVHATFIYTNNAWHIRDGNSTNGTFVNGTKLPKGGQAMLDKGSVIGLGPRVKLKFNAY